MHERLFQPPIDMAEHRALSMVPRESSRPASPQLAAFRAAVRAQLDARRRVGLLYGVILEQLAALDAEERELDRLIASHPRAAAFVAALA